MAERIGRYTVFEAFAAGGAATVHLARAGGPLGFARAVAAKRLHPEHIADSELPLALLDEARLSARIRSPYVVATVDVVATEREILIVMEHVLGESLSGALRRAQEKGIAMPIDVAVAITLNVLHGLHAAHELTDEVGASLELVHRDVSPQNILVGADGIARVLDFGIAKAVGRAQTTRDGAIKGKLAYMSPEQMSGQDVDRRTDVFAAGIVLWEALTSARLFGGTDAQTTIGRVLVADAPRPRDRRPEVSAAVEAVVMKALAKAPSDRYATCLAMADALERAETPATASAVGVWLDAVMHDELATRRKRVMEVERGDERAADEDPPPRAAESTGTASAARASLGQAPEAEIETSTTSTSAREPALGLEPRRRARVWVFAAVAAVASTALFAAVKRAPDASPRALTADPPAASAVDPPIELPSSVAMPPLATIENAAARALDASAVAVDLANPEQKKPRPVAAPPKPKPKCEPVYFDDQGRKRYRRECL